ncbi:DEAD/DEAH box helicase [Bacillus altitudinis]|uniref:DEAD/DEAH box helicase n=1 Tax=Bacillus altitudinis TaxID=293387 RepID=UPI002282BF40|nr:DEAD/DEAH box helicase [Bacillus altitudinis]MCY7533394.1 DEAD/DEAH box helicase [Bacillus altitudinis]
MEKKEKSNLTTINKIETFKEIMQKLTTNIELSYEEKCFILGSALLFLQQYQEDRRYSTYLEFAYYIILKYSIYYEDYTPLYDFSVNFGFYPICKEIINFNLLGDQLSLNDCLAEVILDKHKNKDYIETLHQKKTREKLLDDSSNYICYVAPTSFGKSSLILEHIIQNDQNSNIGVIVPTKSLLIQTYRLIRQSNINRRILIHDEMYKDDERFIAIFTQERALRLLDKNNVYFDILYIDEAHNIFEKNPRSILLTRLIRKNKTLNSNQKVIYLSPLISNSDNLKLENQEDHISEQRIATNLKEPEIYEYRLSGEVFKYNRFVNEFYKIDYKNDNISYILEFNGEKNFIYLRSPKKIEMFAKEFSEKLKDNEKGNKDIDVLIKDLEDFVHKEFFIIELISKGIICLHGKMPDIVKEYLEYKFKNIDNLRFVIANSVILEGINLPIDTLFILNIYSLDTKGLTNLIGRVNRLNNIFNGYSNELEKLIPPIHFVNTETYNRKNSNMQNKIKSLRSRIFEDKIENPTLESFDLDKLKLKGKEGEENFKIIKDNEQILFDDIDDKVYTLKKYLINSGLENVYDVNNKEFMNKLIQRFDKYRNSNSEWENSDIIDKIYLVFIEGLEEFIYDFEFSRLTNIQARNYYKMYLFKFRLNSLKDNIYSTVYYYKKRIKDGDNLIYIGNSYGEVSKSTDNYSNKSNEVYVDLTTKTDAEIVNLSIVKLKIEEDFINYKLNKFVVALHDFLLISQDEYNLSVYGTNDKKRINLIKTGLSLNLINRLQKDDQLKHIKMDHNNNLVTDLNFENYRNKMRGFYRFELDKFL